MSVDGAGLRRAVEGTHAWSGFLTVVCVLALLNIAFWTAHPVLADFSGITWLDTGILKAQVLFVAFLMFGSVLTFSVSGLLDTLMTAIRH